MRISRIHFPVTALGPGRRFGIWVQGCPLACRGCVSRDTWDPTGGDDMNVAELAGLWRRAVAAGADGLTVSGGEPLAQPAPLADLLAAADQARAARDPGGDGGDQPDILVYTGYERSEFDAAQRAALDHVDALITGRYDAAQPTTLLWRGSANQRIIPLTPLGRRRYAPFLDHRPDQPPIQLAVTDGDVWFIGVPRPGGMARLERRLRERGVRFDRATWRP
jgi:anaerobic ribonucleoside-triphosphate reductase activating protein